MPSSNQLKPEFNAAMAKYNAPKGGRRTRRGGAACNGVVSIANAMKRKNCGWTRVNGGKAQLVDKVVAENNNYSGGRRRTRRSTRRSWF